VSTVDQDAVLVWTGLVAPAGPIGRPVPPLRRASAIIPPIERTGSQHGERPEPALRVATPADSPAIDRLMKESAAGLFPGFYDDRQVASGVEHIASVDPMLLEDGTYFVVEADGELVACGGWSRRDRLYTGSGQADGDARLLDPAQEPARVRAMFVRPDWTRRGLGRRILDESERAAAREGFSRVALVATLAGLPLYLAYGFEPLDEAEVTLPDGVTVGTVAMEKAIGGPS
jgi:GNAT superfamily N-acetyltransferase